MYLARHSLDFLRFFSSSCPTHLLRAILPFPMNLMTHHFLTATKRVCVGPEAISELHPYFQRPPRQSHLDVYTYHR